MGVTIDNFFRLSKEGKVNEETLKQFHPKTVYDNSRESVKAIPDGSQFYLFKLQRIKDTPKLKVEYLNEVIPRHLNGETFSHERLMKTISTDLTVENKKITVSFHNKKYSIRYLLLDKNNEDKYVVDNISISGMI